MPAPDINPRQEEILRRLVEFSEGRDDFDVHWTNDDGGGKIAFHSPPSISISITFSDLLGLRDSGMLHLPTITRGQAVGRLTRAAIDAVRSGFQQSVPATSVSIERVGNAVFGQPSQPSPEFNLTPRQRQHVREIVGAAKESGSELFFVATRGGRRFIVFPARQGLGTQDARSIEVAPADVSAFRSQGFIEIEPGTDHGCILQLAYDAVRKDFKLPAGVVSIVNQHFEGVDTGGGAFQVAAGHDNVQHVIVGDSNADLMAQLVSLTAELIGALKVALPIEQAEAAERDALDLTAELQKAKPNMITISSKAGGMWQRIGAGINTAVEFAEKGGKIAEAIGKFAPWLTAIYLAVKSRMQSH